ncbi:uncharacterized [Tachysurus ichikawai]
MLQASYSYIHLESYNMQVTYLAEETCKSRRRLCEPSTGERGCIRCSPYARLFLLLLLLVLSPRPSGSAAPPRTHGERGAARAHLGPL